MSKSSLSSLFGLLLVVVGAIWVLNNVGATRFDLGDFIGQAWPVAIILVGVWLVFGGRSRKIDLKQNGRHEFSHGVGDVDYAPANISPEGLAVRVAAGEVRLDLVDTQFSSPENRVEVRIGFGDVAVRVPRDLPLRVEGRTGVGDLHILDRHSDGFGARLEFEDPEYAAAGRKLLIVAKSGLGDVRVSRA